MDKTVSGVGDIITTAKIGSFDPAKLGPKAKLQWDQLGRRIALMNEFDGAHPELCRFKEWPIIGTWYRWCRLAYVLRREP